MPLPPLLQLELHLLFNARIKFFQKMSLNEWIIVIIILLFLHDRHDRLQQLGSSYGALPVHDGLWQVPLGSIPICLL